ncbi:uncharacterized protein LOC110045999 [Orbicella faveolata]|uniref:uncharacterized protein LOC110045999 n=1 Tax=Orbicella faveolata TaxID=48498 RepID=UPI0009E2C119|nr:uncharacterized protein LOC110045999 [Orbicella faveolata]
MTLQPFQDEHLNYFKFASIVLNEFPKALRHTFRSMWDNTFGHLPGFQPWDDSIAVRNLFLTTEGGTTKVPTNLSYEEWDCTALFQATIYAQSFALPDSKGHHRTLGDLYVKPHKLAHGRFHVSVVSPSGNRAETFALAIDQIRLLRNSLCHSTSSEIVKATFDQYVQLSKDAFKALGIKAVPIDVIGGLTESDFPTKEVRKLEQAIKEEIQTHNKFLEGMSSDIDELRALSTAMNEKLESAASKLTNVSSGAAKVELMSAIDFLVDNSISRVDSFLAIVASSFTKGVFLTFIALIAVKNILHVDSFLANGGSSVTKGVLLIVIALIAEGTTFHIPHVDSHLTNASTGAAKAELLAAIDFLANNNIPLVDSLLANGGSSVTKGVLLTVIDLIADKDIPYVDSLLANGGSSVTKEKEALVSLSVLPESFDLKVAAAVLSMSKILAAKNVLKSLRRRSFLDVGPKSGLFMIHKLLQSFARERGEHEMKETILNAKSRFRAFYVSRFEMLNEQFLTGNSMSAFIEFYEHGESFLTSLIEGCYDSKTSDNAFRALVKAELFLDSLFWCEGDKIDKIYDSAIEAARKDGSNVIYRQLLVSLAFTEVTLGSQGRTMQLLSEGKYEPSSPSVAVDDRGKHLCCSGIYQLVTGKTENGVQLLQEALCLLNDTPEQRILRIITFQMLAIYHRFKKNSSGMSMFYSKAREECRVVGETHLLIIPAMENTDRENGEEEMVLRNSENVINPPLTVEVLCLVSKATEHLPDADVKRSASNTLLNIAKEIEKPLLQSSIGLFNFQRNVNRILQSLSSRREDAAKLSAERIMYHEKAIEKCKRSKENSPIHEPNSATLALHQEALAKSYADHANIQCKMQNYSQAVQSAQFALDIRLELFGEEHSSTGSLF